MYSSDTEQLPSHSTAYGELSFPAAFFAHPQPMPNYGHVMKQKCRDLSIQEKICRCSTMVIRPLINYKNIPIFTMTFWISIGGNYKEERTLLWRLLWVLIHVG